MTVPTMLPELALRSPAANWDRARWEKPLDGGTRKPESGIVSATLPLRAPVAGLFAGAPDTTL